jgi:hypothetical protein
MNFAITFCDRALSYESKKPDAKPYSSRIFGVSQTLAPKWSQLAIWVPGKGPPSEHGVAVMDFRDEVALKTIAEFGSVAGGRFALQRTHDLFARRGRNTCCQMIYVH